MSKSQGGGLALPEPLCSTPSFSKFQYSMNNLLKKGGSNRCIYLHLNK